MNSSLQIRVCVACIAGSFTAALAQDTPPELRTRPEVEAAIARLENKETRLAALEQLIPFAVTGEFQVGSVSSTTGDEEKDALIRKARAAIVRYHNFDTFSKALNLSSELADDPSSSVRKVVPLGVRDDDLERPEVQVVLARLLKDESPLVRYRAIVKLGPEKHTDELRELASGSDQYVAELAKRRLRQLDQKGP